MSDFTFDEATHTYRLGGDALPSVTGVIKELYSFGQIPEWVLDHASARGRAVHLACEYEDKGGVDEDSLDVRIVPYVRAYRKFMSENKVIWTAIERKDFHPQRRYAGTLDRCGSVNGRHTLVDIKTCATLSEAVGVQLAGYVEIERANAKVIPARAALQLMADGRYHFHPYGSPDDLPCFMSLLTLHNWRLRHAA
jgi:hypothetical protein